VRLKPDDVEAVGLIGFGQDLETLLRLIAETDDR
jgi:hypothetical protein